MPTHESDTVEGKVFAPATGTSPFEDVLERRARSRAIANDDDDDDDDDESGVRWASDGLLVIDVQLDFMDPDGALAVKGGNEIVDVVCDLAEKFRVIVASQDYHPKGHMSFASEHAGKKAYDEVEFSYGTQTLWPDHCVQGTKGCEFHPDLRLPARTMVVRKGYNREVDSYSAFYENDKVSGTGLEEYLRAQGVTRVFLVGLAYDFCVKYTALDARSLGFDVVVVKDACRGVAMEGTMEAADAELAAAGVRTIFTVPTTS